MTDNVIPLKPRSREPGGEEPRELWSQGTAVCLDCRHEWQAVAPQKTQFLECPGCGLEKGRFKFAFAKLDEPHWHCNCGNELFQITEQGAYCPNCGKDQEW